jgi:hypothetical protein
LRDQPVSLDALLERHRQLRGVSRDLTRIVRELRLQARAIREQVMRRQLRYPLARALHLKGSSDQQQASLPGSIRAKLAAGVLPRSVPLETWFGRGTRDLCGACDLPVGPAQVEVEATFAPSAVLRFHASCFRLWDAERTRGV